MKDLYTFDASVEAALATYREVFGAYLAFFADLKLPMLVAEASSGTMGGDHSHEFHLANPIGEDTVVACGSCDYTASDQVAVARPSAEDLARASGVATVADFVVWRGITKDHKTLVNVWYPRRRDSSADADINTRAVQEAVPELDASIGDPARFLGEAVAEVVNVVDPRLAAAFAGLQTQLPVVPAELGNVPTRRSVTAASSLVRPVDGDGCSRCEDGTLRTRRALELGHAFYLGTRYSQPLGLRINGQRGSEALQMGCYGIGVSRIIGAVAEHLADDRGLNWPHAIAPFEVAVVPSSDAVAAAQRDFYDALAGRDAQGSRLDVVLDDRDASFGWKMRDADTVGFPVIVVLGQVWRKGGACEVQCRRLGSRELVAANEVRSHVAGLLSRL